MKKFEYLLGTVSLLTSTEKEWLPVTPNAMLPLDKIGGLLAGRQYVQAMRHLTVYCKGTEFQPEIDRLTEELKQLAKDKNLGIISGEYFLMHQNRLAAGSKELLDKLVVRETSKGKKWWKQIWPFS